MLKLHLAFTDRFSLAQSEHDMPLSTQITCSASLTATEPIFSDGTHHVSSYRDNSHVNDVDVVVVVVAVVVVVVVVVDVAGGGLEHPCKEIARNTSTETARHSMLTRLRERKAA